MAFPDISLVCRCVDLQCCQHSKCQQDSMIDIWQEQLGKRGGSGPAAPPPGNTLNQALLWSPKVLQEFPLEHVVRKMPASLSLPWHNLEPPCPLGHQSLRPVIAAHRLLPVSVLCTSPGLCRENGECGWDDWWPVWLPAPALCRKPGHTLLAPLSTLPPASLPLLSGWPEI